MNCVACQKPLTLEIVLEVEQERDEENVSEDTKTCTVPDSVEMQCGCLFHWQCLVNAYSMTECPSCGRELSLVGPSGEQKILCNLNNEGGLQVGLDILPLLTEESYLKAYPEERRCRAFLEFCAEGDVDAMVNLLDDDEDKIDDGSEDSVLKIDVLRYQDPMGSMNSGLHAAILKGREEIVWLLLLLASKLEMKQFPPEVLQRAETLDIAREDQAEKVDICSLRDFEGMTAEQRAKEIGGVWKVWVDSGRLNMGTS